MTDPVDRFMAFVHEREEIRFRRTSGQVLMPFTEDPILQTYKFCNIRREDDRTTVWIRENWREPHRDDPDLFFAMVVARFVNKPTTLAEIGYPVPWDRVRFLRVMRDISRRGDKPYGPAYMIRADSTAPGKAKPVYQADEMFDPMWRKRKQIRPQPGDTLNAWHMTLGLWHGLASFMGAQIVADMRYVEPLRSASDWMTFAASGPGSRRGLNRLLGRAPRDKWEEDDWRLKLVETQTELNDRMNEWGWEPLHAQDVQNCLCEWDKYERTRLGEGRPKQKFTPHA